MGSLLVPRVVGKDFYEGHDPGMTMARLVGADSTLLTTASSWSLKVWDLSAGPPVDITPGQPGTFSGSQFGAGSPPLGNPRLFSSLQLGDGFWSEDNIGYNFRHYVKWSDFNTPALKGGRTYRFEYQVVTPDYDGTTAQAWGTFVIVREGTCRELFR